MAWRGLLKRERRNDLETVYQDHSWNWDATFHGLSGMQLSVVFQTRLHAAMTMIVRHVAMTMILLHLQQWLHRTNRDFMCLIILLD